MKCKRVQKKKQESGLQILVKNQLSDKETIEEYNLRVSDCVGKYESLKFEDLHSDILDLIPEKPGLILDVGSGSGRDASWFARKGWDVVAVDPAAQMLQHAKSIHNEAQIRWIKDSLPALDQTMRLGLSFDIVWLSAVWMHLPPDSRARAFRKMVTLLRPAGWIMLSLRHGDFPDNRKAYPVSRDEIERFARQHGMAVRRACKSEDRMGRTGVEWEWICLQLPDDGTEALPLLRHTILTDSKSSTYKLALLRVLIRIADSAIGVVRDVDDDTISVPFGLVALYWIRMYKPLIEHGVPQMPSSTTGSGLGFVKEAFHGLKDYSHYDLRVGHRFSGPGASLMLQALLDARDTIKKMPAHYITFPNSSEQVFKANTAGRVPRKDSFVLSAEFLWSFGEIYVPRQIWQSMCRFASWIEPALITEWIRLMQDYGARKGQRLSFDELIQLLTWLEPERDTTEARQITSRLLAAGEPIYCVWSGKKLQGANLDIDHCFPFSAWPCGDLWNLMPSLRTLNQREKTDKLVTAETISKASERIHDWWGRAYLNTGQELIIDRFYSEAYSSLPGVDASPRSSSSDILAGMLLKRAALKRDLQLDDWSY